jgi:hypothetical protein
MLSLGFRVLHGPKNNQSLCNIVMGILSLKIGLMEYVCLTPNVLHSKNINAIPSSCIYKSSKNSNYKIRDFFMMKVLHKIMPLSINALPQMFGLQLQYFHVLAMHPINFLFNVRCTYTIYGS